MDYSYLKKSLKDLKKSSLPEEALERSFIAAVDAEVKKVNDFFMVTSQQLSARLDSFIKLVTHENFYVSSSDSLQQEIDGFVRDLVDLDAYVKVNFEGFRKIMKKHDKVTGRQGSPWFMQRLKEQPFHTNSNQFSALILKFSKCCAGCRRVIGGDELPISFDTGKGMDRAIVKSFKLFVKKEDIMKVKTELARNLPIFLYNPEGKDTKESSSIWSCYYDDNKLSVYEGKLSGKSDNISIRFRTYENSKTVRIERAISYGDKRAAGREAGVKDTIDMPHDDVFDFIQGTYTQGDYTTYLNARGVPGREQKALIDLFLEVQNYIREKNLTPVLSTKYRRTYFQNPRNKTITVSLDEDVEFIRELFHFTDDGPRWHRPASSVPEKEKADFSHAVLEIKLSLPRGVEFPAWVERILNSPHTESVENFSKFAQGCATLCYDKIHREPKWMAMLDKKNADKMKQQDIYDPDRQIAGGGFRIQSFDIEDFSDSGSLLHRRKKKEQKESSFYDSLASAFPSPSDGNGGGKSRDYGTFCCPDGQAADMKVEPKTFFANERTFIQWASFCVVIQTIGVAFVGFSSPGEGRSGAARIGGEIYLMIAFLFLLYSLYNFRSRSFRIQNQEHGNYDDFYGPFLLVLCLSVACIVNLSLSFSSS